MIPRARVSFARRILTEVDHLSQMVNELLELSRIESGKIELRLEPTDIAGVIEVALDRMRPIADERGITLRAETPRGAAGRAGGWQTRRRGADEPDRQRPEVHADKWRRDGLGGMLRATGPPNKSQPRGRKSAPRATLQPALTVRVRRHRRGHPL